VNNAGLYTRERQSTADGLESTFAVNHLGPFLLTVDLLDVLKASAPSRIVNVSSGLHYRGKMDWDDLMYERKSFSASDAYNQSKLANVLFTTALAQRLAGTGVTANALHPGVVATELIREYPAIVRKVVQFFMLTPEKGAQTSLYLAMSPDVAGVTGKYFDKSREKLPAAVALDREAQERLWRVSEPLVGLSKRDAAA
jgi:NAD(P)-dependent dehydrogenase (short-subunit alcohol dehydrogenase family)